LGMLSHIEIAYSAASFLIESMGLDILVMRVFCSYILNVLRV
jgi:hypothetical protein